MKKALLLGTLFCLILTACKEQKQTETQEIDALNEEQVEEIVEVSKVEKFGAEKDFEVQLNEQTLLSEYQKLNTGDSLHTSFTGIVESVCQKKGCWSVVQLAEDKSVRVTFKDYGFFLPKDIAQQRLEINGVAFLQETSVDDLRHFAEDEGKSEEEIAAITEPKLSYAFVADAVRLYRD
ncbi:MAG: DUF4920 domain-containing protein [Flavobacteriaceae bacterium]|nr:DUF4920 domain-containing protein [Flavobacteriaceae bacterium]